MLTIADYVEFVGALKLELEFNLRAENIAIELISMFTTFKCM
jgi:hypothetical protein